MLFHIQFEAVSRRDRSVRTSHESESAHDRHGVLVAVDATGVHRLPYEVERGLACGCRCLSCGAEVVARHGEIRAWHFAHHGNSGGPRCGEGALHMLGKAALRNYVGRCLGTDGPGFGLFDIRLLRVQLEVLIPSVGRRVDVLADVALTNDSQRKLGSPRKGPAELIIEVCVANPKDAAYKADMRKAGRSAIELVLTPETMLDYLKENPGVSAERAARALLRRKRSWRWLNWRGHEHLICACGSIKRPNASVCVGCHHAVRT